MNARIIPAGMPIQTTDILRCTGMAVIAILLDTMPCNVRAAEQAVVSQEPMAWPQEPLLSCRARVQYAKQFLQMMKQGLPEERIQFASDWEPAEELNEILEIRRRVYHDRDGLNEILACAMGSGT